MTNMLDPGGGGGSPLAGVPHYQYNDSEAKKLGSPINIAWREGSAKEIADWMTANCGWTNHFQHIDRIREMVPDNILEKGVGELPHLGEYFINGLYERPRYIKMEDDGEVIETTEHVMKSLGKIIIPPPVARVPIPTPVDSPHQYHIRLYDYDGPGDVSVIGQAHKDPLDHGHISDRDDLPGGVLWRYDEARDAAVQCWEENYPGRVSVVRHYVGNYKDSDSTHDGRIVVIRRD